MFKLVVLSALIAVAFAHPGLYGSSAVVYSSAPAVAVHEHAYAKVGEVVKSIPSSVSHQSHSVVHSSAHVVEDVLAPAVKTSSYVTKTLATPVVATYAAVPAYVKTVSHPVVHTSYAAAPVVYKSW